MKDKGGLVIACLVLFLASSASEGPQSTVQVLSISRSPSSCVFLDVPDFRDFSLHEPCKNVISPFIV